MTDSNAKSNIRTARDLMDHFAERTGLEGNGGNIRRRYLWTDALAVQTLFSLSEACDEPRYSRLAIKLVDAVHTVLGKYREDDARSGWISGLGEEDGARRPTLGGLRIGKKLPERPPGGGTDERLEWDRDGQYFHYLTRWMMALLSAASATGDERYEFWAADLMSASARFIDETEGRLHMYWKMSTDLTRPLIFSQGAQDPLEGLLCAHAIQLSEHGEVQDRLIECFSRLCSGRHWMTVDPLGLGGLLIHADWASQLVQQDAALPSEVQPHVLIGEAVEGLSRYVRGQETTEAASRRLAFRECGLALGLRIADKKRHAPALPYEQLERYKPLGEQIERFWCGCESQRAATWLDHLDINSVSLAASLAASACPGPFELHIPSTAVAL